MTSPQGLTAANENRSVTSLHEVEEIRGHRRELRNEGKQDCYRYEGPSSWTSEKRTGPPTEPPAGPPR